MADDDDVLLLQRVALNYVVAQMRAAEPKSDGSCVRNSCNGVAAETREGIE